MPAEIQNKKILFCLEVRFCNGSDGGIDMSKN